MAYGFGHLIFSLLCVTEILGILNGIEEEEKVYDLNCVCVFIYLAIITILQYYYCMNSKNFKYLNNNFLEYAKTRQVSSK